MLILALHELATNAVAHGALSTPGGTVSVTCKDTSEGAVVEWMEPGGPRLLVPPARPGFGLRLLGERILSAAGMAADLRFEPEEL
jgi:two-component sensor histidine kinase